MKENTIDYEDDLEKMRQKIRRRKKQKRNRILFVSILALAIFLITFFILNTKSYSSYKVVSSVAKEDEVTSKYKSYKKGYISYSNGGVSYVDEKGKNIWNIAYNMSNPYCSISDNIIAVADMKGNQVIVLNENGELGKFQTQFNIMQAIATANGMVLAILQNETDSFINMYKQDGSVVFSIKTSIEGDGYPVDATVSKDGRNLVVSFVKTKNGKVETSVVFYDFSNANADKILGGFDNFDNHLIADIDFIDNNTVVAIADNSITYYKIKNLPKQEKRFDLNMKVKKVIWGEKKVAIVSQEEDESEKVIIYNANGGKLCEKTLPNNYTSFVLNKDTFVATNENSFYIIEVDGKKIIEKHIDGRLVSIIPNGSRSKYFLITDRYIQRINLR